MNKNIMKKTFVRLFLTLIFGFSGESLMLADQGDTPMTRFLDLHNQVAKKNTSTASSVPSQQPAATSLKTQAGLLAALKATGMTVSTAASLVSGTVLPSWNVTINGAWTYSCISSGTVPAAGAVDFTKIAAPLTTAQINAGISTIMLAVDATGTIIADITKTAPASWAMYMFDATGAALPNTPVSIAPASGSPVGKTTQLATSVFAGSAIGFTVNGAAPINGTYPMMFTLQATQGTVLTQPIYLNAPLQSLNTQAWVGSILYLWSEFTLQANSLAAINQAVTDGVSAMMGLAILPNDKTGFYDATFVVSNATNWAILAAETYPSIINASGATLPTGRYPANKPYPYLDPVTHGTNAFASTANFSYQLAGQNIVGVSGVPYSVTNMLMFMPAQV